MLHVMMDYTQLHKLALISETLQTVENESDACCLSVQVS